MKVGDIITCFNATGAIDILEVGKTYEVTAVLDDDLIQISGINDAVFKWRFIAPSE